MDLFSLFHFKNELHPVKGKHQIRFKNNFFYHTLFPGKFIKIAPGTDFAFLQDT